MSKNLSSELYRQLAEFPTYRAGHFQGENVFRVHTSTIDHERSIKRQSVRTYVISEGSHVYASISPDEAEVIASQVSPSGKYLAVLREVADSAAPGGKKRFVEVWSGDKIEASQEVTQVHEAFYTDEHLSSISFSPSETRVVYTAEAKPNESTESDPFAKYRFVHEFGESYGGKKRSAIFLFDWKRKGEHTVAKLSLSAQLSDPPRLAHAVFAGENTIYAIGYEHLADDRVLGVIYCTNRATSLWELTIPDGIDDDDKEVKCSSIRTTPTEESSRSPRVLRGSEDRPAYLVWLSNAVGGPHAMCSSLRLRDLSTGETRTVVETVWDPEPSKFPGLYVNNLPFRPFVTVCASDTDSDIPCVVLSSIWRSRLTVLLISLTTGDVVDLTPNEDGMFWSWTVLSTDGGNQILCARNAPNRPAELVLGRIGKDNKVSWKIIARPALSDELKAKLDEITTTIIPIPDHHPAEMIVVRRQTPDPIPCITMPHGGPHSPSTTVLNAWTAALVLDGYVVSYPNYTGSIGYGEKYVRKLMGQIGTLDIEDCIASVRHLVSLGITKEGPGYQYLLGGSHGGFIIGNLIGQYPDVFSGAILRNPVISVGEISTSDIPDWYFEESGVPFKPTSIVTPEIYEKFYRLSPIAHVDAVKTPIVLLIGEKDQRVAPTQGKNYYHALKARGKDVEMLCFKDDMHPIDSVDGLRVTFEAAYALFSKTKTEQK